MPQRDVFHDPVKNALVEDGWTITDDPYTIAAGGQNVFVDLGAERLIAATRGTEKIAVEIKSFVGRSAMADLQQALGQYLLYRALLVRQEPDRKLFLAVPVGAYEGVLSTTIGNVAVDEYDVHLVVVDIHKARIEQWRK